MPFWMPLRKGKNKSETALTGSYELSPEVMWKLYTLAEDLPRPASAHRFSAPGVYTGGTCHALSPELAPPKGTLLLPKLDFKKFPFLLFIVGNELTVSSSSSGEKGSINFPFLSYFDRQKLYYHTHVKCGVFTSLNVTLTPSLQRRRFRCNFINHYS